MFIALGTNLGNRMENLHRAVQALEPQVRVIRRSPVYETPPWGYLDQPAFYNQVVQGETQLEPLALLRHLKAIEASMGREKTIANGPRVIDLDILFYGERVIQVDRLSIPHPRLRGRAFVLLPLAEIAPDLRHPELGITARELLAEADTAGIKLVAGGKHGDKSCNDSNR